MTEQIIAGDTVRITSVDNSDIGYGINVGQKYSVERVDYDTEIVVINAPGMHGRNMWISQVEKVEDNNMTFVEIISKVIAGVYDKGTELEVATTPFYNRKFYVSTNAAGDYGLSSTLDYQVAAPLSVAMLNGKWSVVEEVKEMTIEEIQEELGYKIKVVE